MDEGLSPNDIAKICGVSADTIRHYERQAVIPLSVRLPNGYRRFPAGTVERVRIVRAALRLGFTIEEIAKLVKQRGTANPPCAQARALAAGKLREVEQRIAELEALRDDIRAVLAEWDDRLARTAAGVHAHLLDALNGDHDDFSDRSSVPLHRGLPDARRARTRR